MYSGCGVLGRRQLPLLQDRADLQSQRLSQVPSAPMTIPGLRSCTLQQSSRHHTKINQQAHNQQAQHRQVLLGTARRVHLPRGLNPGLL